MTVRCVHRGRMDAAVRSGNLKVVQELIRSGTDVNEPFSVRGDEGSLLTIYSDCARAQRHRIGATESRGRRAHEG